MTDLLHDKVDQAARDRGAPPPQDTSAIYTLAVAAAPGLLDQLISVHQLADRERGGYGRHRGGFRSLNEGERKRMLSVVRATVYRRRRRAAR